MGCLDYQVPAKCPRLAYPMQYRLVLIVDVEELALDIYFKREEIGLMWIKHHYMVVGALVHALKRTRDYELVLRRVL